MALSGQRAARLVSIWIMPLITQVLGMLRFASLVAIVLGLLLLAPVLSYGDVFSGKDLVLSASERGRLEKAARNGDPSAAFSLWRYYEFVKTDRERSFEWISLAAHQGHAVAQYNLGKILLQSTKDEDRAAGIRWLRKAASQGNGPALRELNRATNPSD